MQYALISLHGVDIPFEWASLTHLSGNQVSAAGATSKAHLTKLMQYALISLHGVDIPFEWASLTHLSGNRVLAAGVASKSHRTNV